MDKIKDVVEAVMRNDRRTCGSDKWLIIETLREMGFKIYIPYQELQEMPAFESITRCGRKLRADNPELRPFEVIQHNRKKREEAIREWSVR